MSGVVKALKKVAGVIIDAVKDFASLVWNELVMPQLEFVFSVFGIVDETVVTVSKVSSKMFDDNEKDVVKAAKARAIMRWLKSDVSLWKFIHYEMYLTRGRVTGYYRYAEKGHYVNGLPSMSVQAENKDGSAIKDAIDAEYSVVSTVTYSSNSFPTAEEYFKFKLQNPPTNYNPGLDKLTYDDEEGVTYDDWSVSDIVYLDGSNEYEITITRTAERAHFWLEGPTKVTEGGTVNLIVRCNRDLPAGESVTVNFTYSGSTPSNQYNAPQSVVIGSGLSSAYLPVQILEDAVTESAGNILVTLDSITNTNGAFEAVAISNSTVDISVYDNDSVVLTMDSVYVNESSSSVTIPVKLGKASSGPFTVDYKLTDGTASAGIDYDGTGGTLSFSGSSGESNSIVIPLTADVSAESREYFTVSLINCSDGSVNSSRTATVTIMDSLPNGPQSDTAEVSTTFTRPQFEDERAMVCKYYVEGENSNEWYYWIYYYSTDKYPDVDPTATTLNELDMLPVGIIRKDKTNVDSDKSTKEYRTTRKLLSLLQLSIDDLIEGVEGNPDKDMIDDAYVNFSVCPNDEGPEVSKLLYLMFYEIIYIRGLSSNSDKYYALFEEQDVNNACVWTNQSYTTDIMGSVCPVGEHTHLMKFENVKTGEKNEHGFDIYEEQGTLIVRFQKTEAFYDEVSITNMSSMSAIRYDGYHKTAFNVLGDDSFTLPMSLYVYDQLTNEELMKVYQKIFRIDFYSIEVTHLEWYETPRFFKFLKFAMAAVAIVTTALTLGGASGFWAGVWAVMQQFAIQYIVMEVVVAIAEATGNAYLAAAIALVTAFVLKDMAGLEQTGFLTAQGITEAVSTYTAALGTVYKKEYADMVVETEKLIDEMEEKENYYEENSPKTGSILDASFYASISGSGSMFYQARDAQYDYDSQLTGAYDRLIGNYHSLLLELGVT